VPLRYVLRLLDALHRAGARSITFEGSLPPGPRTFPEAARAVPAGGWAIELGGERVGGRDRETAPPRLRRHRGGLMGFLDEPTDDFDPPEELEEVPSRPR
jgi:hypothetical protein